MAFLHSPSPTVLSPAPCQQLGHPPRSECGSGTRPALLAGLLPGAHASNAPRACFRCPSRILTAVFCRLCRCAPRLGRTAA
eukprot:4328092-Pleurochrysis_carterae.AAC.4